MCPIKRLQVHVFMSQSKQISSKKLLFTSRSARLDQPESGHITKILVMKRKKRKSEEEKKKRGDGMGW